MFSVKEFYTIEVLLLFDIFPSNRPVTYIVTSCSVAVTKL